MSQQRDARRSACVHVLTTTRTEDPRHAVCGAGHWSTDELRQETDHILMEKFIPASGLDAVSSSCSSSSGERSSFCRRSEQTCFEQTKRRQFAPVSVRTDESCAASEKESDAERQLQGLWRIGRARSYRGGGSAAPPPH